MKFSRTILGAFALVLCSLAHAQAWADSYNDGLRLSKEAKWTEAREAFLKAVANRADDFSNPTRLPGPVTERRTWRNGSPYSANFAAAYTGIKAANGLEDAAKKSLLMTVSDEFETILKKDQHSPEAYYFLAQTYASLRDVAKQQDLQTRYQSMSDKLNWKIDGEILTPEDKAAMGQMAGSSSTAGQANPLQGGGSGPMVPPVSLQNKFGLLIGNSETKLENLKVPFAASDALLLREKLVQFSGYQETNIDVVQNASSAQVRATAQALAERVPVGSTIFLYFSGPGVNLDGKDFLAGIEAKNETDSASMVSKSEIYTMFMKKGCKIFTFYQCHRPIVSGRYFGQETPMVGAIAQTQATIPNGKVSGIVRNGSEVGLFTDALAGVLGEFRSNQVPLTEFAWRVFNWMRGGKEGESGSGSEQTMTLPVIVNMLSDERF